MSSSATNFDIAPHNALAAAVGNSAREMSTDGMRRREEVLVALGRRAIAAPSWRMLAYDAAALVAETLETDQFAVAELSDDRVTLSLRIGNSGAALDDAAAAAIPVPCEPTTSIAGYALSVAQTVATADLTAETRFHDQLLRQQGMTAAAAMPLLWGSSYFAPLVICSTQPRNFVTDELHYFETIAHLVSTTIAHERTRELLDQERRFQAAVLDSAASLLVVLSPDGQIQQINRAVTKSLGFELDDLRDRPIASALLVPEELPVVTHALEQVSNSLHELMMETWVLAKSGERKRFQWSLAALADDSDQLERIVLTGIDVTRQRELETELTQVRSAAGTDEQRPFSPIPEGPGGERRQRLRRSFPYVQMIAPLIDGQPPEQHHFRPVRCRDISPTGFSFLSPIPPDFQDLIVALGGEATITYLAARVMHATIIEKDDQVAYIVGCRYLSRAKLDETAN